MKFTIACLTILICLPSLARYETNSGSVTEVCHNSPEADTIVNDYAWNGLLNTVSEENDDEQREPEGGPGGNI